MFHQELETETAAFLFNENVAMGANVRDMLAVSFNAMRSAFSRLFMPVPKRYKQLLDYVLLHAARRTQVVELCFCCAMPAPCCQAPLSS